MVADEGCQGYVSVSTFSDIGSHGERKKTFYQIVIMATQEFIPLTNEQKMKVLVKARSAMLGVSAKLTMFDVVADKGTPRVSTTTD